MNRLDQELSEIIEGVSIGREAWLRELPGIIDKAVSLATERFDEPGDMLREYSDGVVCVDVRDRLDYFQVEVFPILHGTGDPTEEGSPDTEQPLLSITIRPARQWLEHLKALPVALPSPV